MTKMGIFTAHKQDTRLCWGAAAFVFAFPALASPDSLTLLILPSCGLFFFF